MLKLLRLFVDIALWRKGPQDLPPSVTLLCMCVVTYVTTSFIQVRLLGFTPSAARTLTFIDIATSALLIASVLFVMGRGARLLQTLTAVLGVGSLLGLLDIVIRGLLMLTTGSYNDPLILSVLKLMLALALIGRILMHALETGLFTGMALTFAMVLATQTIASMFVQMPQSVSDTG